MSSTGKTTPPLPTSPGGPASAKAKKLRKDSAASGAGKKPRGSVSKKPDLPMQRQMLKEPGLISSDHLPIFASIKHSQKKVSKMKTVTRRCCKSLTKESWCNNLIAKNWEELGSTENVDDMAKIITNLVSESLDECAPVKTFKIRNQNKHGISENTRHSI